MKSKIIELLLVILLLLTISTIAIVSINRINSSELELKAVYEKGLYDGFFRTVNYIDSMSYFKLGDIEFTQPEVDSFLHKKLN